MVRNLAFPGPTERNGVVYQRHWDAEDRIMAELQSPTDHGRGSTHGNPQYANIEAALNQCGIEHFAIIVVQDGRLREYTSKSLRASEKHIITPRVQQAFQQALYMTGDYNYQGSGQHIGVEAYTDFDTDSGEGSRRMSASTDSSIGRKLSRNCRLGSSEDEDPWNARNRKRNRAQAAYQPRYGTVQEDDMPIPIPVSHTRQLKISDGGEVTDFYGQRFKDLQQSACKVVAKAFVKIIEPKKQTNHPYTGGRAKAPAWWPLPSKEGGKDGVRHREPDHLLKPERIKLLVHILGLVIDPHAAKPQHMKAISVKKLEEVTNEAMSNWFADKENLDNAAKRPLLKEIFKVAKQQERYMKGEIDETASVPVAHGDNVGINGSDDEPDDGLNYDEDGPSLVTIPTPDSLVSPSHTSSNQTSMHTRASEHDESAEIGGYGIRDLPVRSSFSHLPPPNSDQGYTDHHQMPIANPSSYIPNRSMYQHPSPLLDPQQPQQRRQAWQTDTFSNPAQQNMYNNWPSAGSIMSNDMSYSAYTTGPPTQGQHPTPYLPPPTNQPNVLPPMHQSYGESLPRSNGFESLRTGSIGQSHHMSQGSNGYTQYMQDGSYAQVDEGIKTDGHIHTN